MGRGNKEYSKSLHQQAHDRLVGMQAFGQSKADAKLTGADKDKIFSYSTYSTYWKHTKYFVSYVQENHPNVTTLSKAEKYVPEFLQSRVDQGLSAWTVQTEAKALGKLYGITPGSKYYFECPKRERADIKRSRDEAARDKHFSVTNNAELIKFCQGTGLRRSELENLKGNHMVTLERILNRGKQLEEKALTIGLSPKEQHSMAMINDVKLFQGKYDNYLFVRGKGGRERLSPIIGPYEKQIVNRMLETGKDEKVWQNVHSNADIHGYRGEYATKIYKENARDIATIPYDKVNKGTGARYQSEVYHCRKDEAGRKLDKRAMLLGSKALGHNRIEVIANNYLRGI